MSLTATSTPRVLLVGISFIMHAAKATPLLCDIYSPSTTVTSMLGIKMVTHPLHVLV